MKTIMQELDEIVGKQGKGSVKDSLLLAEMKAIDEKNVSKGTKMYEDHVADLPKPDKDTATIISNIRNNLGMRYFEARNMKKAEAELKEAVRIREAFSLANTHDGLT